MAIEKAKGKREAFLARLILIFAIMANVAFLGYFKYGNFITNLTLSLSSQHSWNLNIPIVEAMKTIGMSYYTFKIISHLVDSYSGRVATESWLLRKDFVRTKYLKNLRKLTTSFINIPSFIDFACYTTFFPQLLMGPLGRAQTFYQELNYPKKYGHNYDINAVIMRILSGLLKKYVISSYLFVVLGEVFKVPQQYSTPDLLIAPIIYGCMLYVDMSGYADFAVAISNLLGFSSPENFNSPYSAQSLKDFWSRWHISLSQWFRDYVYIPLGGSRRGPILKAINLIITMTVSGLWHGAGLNFIAWGAYHGIFSVLSYGLENAGKLIRKPKFITWFGKAFMWIFTFLVAMYGWALFAVPDMETFSKFIDQIIHSDITINTLFSWRILAVTITILIFNFIGNSSGKLFVKCLQKLHPILKILLISAIGYIIIRLGPDLVPPFVYFNF